MKTSLFSRLKLMLFFICCFQIVTTFSQPIWQKQINAGSDNIQFFDTECLPDGDFLLAGYAFPPAYDSTMALLIRTDSSLNIKWTKRYRYLQDGNFRTITALNDGTYLVGGYARDYISSVVGAIVIKMNSDGNIIWSRWFDDSFADSTLKMFENPDGSLMIFIRNGVSAVQTKIVKLNSSGIITDQFYLKQAVENSNIIAESITSDADYHFYMTGRGTDSLSNERIFILKMTDTIVSWYHEYSFNRAIQQGRNITFLNDGNLGVTAYLTDSINLSDNNFVLIKLDTAGQVLWTNEGLISGSSDFAEGVLGLSNNDLLAYGNTGSGTSPSAVMVKYNMNGNLLWGSGSSTTGCDYWRDAIEYPDHRLFLTGTYGTSTGGNFLLASGDGTIACDFFDPSFVVNNPQVELFTYNIIKKTQNLVPYSTLPVISNFLQAQMLEICESVTGMTNKDFSDQIIIYPNPVRDFINIEFKENSHGIFVELDDMTGRNLKKNILNSGENYLKISMKGMSSCPYLLIISDNGKVCYKKIIYTKQ